MGQKKIKVRLFVESDLTQGGMLVLAKGQAHYLGNVMRTNVGDVVAVFNGRDGEWLACVDGLTKGGCNLVVEQQIRVQETEPDLWLVFAPLKKSRTYFLVEKACELGASRIMPVFTRHTDIKRLNVERLRATAIEASEQCERLSVPEVAGPVAFDRLISEWPDARRLLVPVETGGGRPMLEALSVASGGIMIGPEGGFSSTELEVFGKLPFVEMVGLGPRILRAETAALAALTCWQVVAGDWRKQRAR